MVERVAEFFGLDDDYVRPAADRPWRTDGIVAALLTGISVSLLMFMRDMNDELRHSLPLVPSFVAIGSQASTVSGFCFSASERFVEK